MGSEETNEWFCARRVEVNKTLFFVWEILLDHMIKEVGFKPESYNKLKL